jgi:hypothetical protein
MSDRLKLSLLAAFALLMVALSAVWPQGLGDRSPAPFGHTPLERTPAMQAALARATAKAQRQIQENREAAEAAKRAAADRNGPLKLSPHAMPLPETRRPQPVDPATPPASAAGAARPTP